MDEDAHMLLSSSLAAQDGKYVSDKRLDIDSGVIQLYSVVTERGVSNTIGVLPPTGVVSAVSRFAAPGCVSVSVGAMKFQMAINVPTPRQFGHSTCASALLANT